MRRVVPLLAVCCGMASSAEAVAIRYDIQPSFTSIAFDVDNWGGLFTTHGEFRKFRGVLLLDLDAPENSRVDVIADSASVATGWSVSDDMLHSPDYFDPPRFPTVHYVADRVQRLDAARVLLHGRMTIRGVTLPQDFTAQLEGRHDVAGEGPVANFVVTGDIDRDAYGMTADHPLVASTVAVKIRAHVRLTPQDADVR